MNLEFEVENQILSRTDFNQAVNKSRNYLEATFSFLTDDWEDLEKFAIFTNSKRNNFRVGLGTGETLSCIIPSEVLLGDYFWVTVYGGDLITTNSRKIPLLVSGYTKKVKPTKVYDKDIFVQMSEKLAGKFEAASYEDGELIFYNILSDGTRDVIQRVDLHVEQDISENMKLGLTQLSNAILSNGL